MKLMLDPFEYKSKPTDPGRITNRIVNYPVDISPPELASQILKGKSFVPAYINTRKHNGELSRAIECWTSQEIICLDFDNEREIPHPTEKKKKIKVKDVRMTLEQALDEFKDTAMFIYTSFNHKPDHPKFRVVFATEELTTSIKDVYATLEHFQDKYPYLDKKCIDPARLFYGGKEMYVLNYDNRIKVQKSLINTNKNDDFEFCHIDSTRVLSNDYQCHKTPPISNIVIDKDNNINISNMNMVQFIRNKEVHRLQQILNPTPIQIYTYSESVEYIKKQDMMKFLGLNGSSKFNCIFHHDTFPSASIYPSRNSNDILYTCGSNNCSFGTGNIIKVVERLTGCTRRQALKFLRDVYRVDFQHTEWQKEQIENLEENIRYVQSSEFAYEYPKQYKLMKRYIGDLVQFWQVAKDYIPPEHYSLEQSKFLFFSSLSQFARLYGNKTGKKVDERRINDKIALFVYLSYIRKLKEDEIPKDLLKESKKFLVKNRSQSGQSSFNLVQYYEAYPLMQDNLVFAEMKAQEYEDHYFTQRGWSWEMLARSLGEDEANRVYPQNIGRQTKIREKSHEMAKEIENAAMELINQKGWATENEILEIVGSRIVTTKTGKQRQMKKILDELIQKYELVRVRINKELTKKTGIQPIMGDKGLSYPFVLLKRDMLETTN